MEEIKPIQQMILEQLVIHKGVKMNLTLSITPIQNLTQNGLQH